MNPNPNKKIPVILLISSCVVILYSLLAKEYNPLKNKEIYFLSEKNIKIPVSHYTINFLGLNLPFLQVLFISIILLAIGAYLYLYSTDNQIKALYKKTKEHIVNKKELITVSNLNIKTKKNPTDNTLLRGFLVISIVLTFIFSLKTSFYISFFLPLAYYYYIDISPSTKKILLTKAIVYPLLFALALSALSAFKKSSYMFGYYFGQEIVLVFLPYLICVIMSYMLLIDKLKNIGRLSYKPAILLIVGLFVIIGIAYFAVSLYMEAKLEGLQN